MQKLTDLEADVTQREKDIINIAKSISELAEIFNDLNMLVIDQVSLFIHKCRAQFCFRELFWIV